MTERYVLDLDATDGTRGDLVGGKAANLGALTEIEGVRVPDGFCVTTEAFRLVTARTPGLDGLLDALSATDPEDRAALAALAAAIRHAIEETPLPDGLAEEITDATARLGADAACAVRSSATAEDLPTASFAGQQDTYLNVLGPAEVLRHVGRCWASLFTDRAVAYRARRGIDHRAVRMAVIVQRMVLPHASGILFTADPVTGDRTVSTVDAGLGLGEAMVSGLVTPDVYAVRDDEIRDRSVAVKERALRALPGGGVHEVPVDPALRERPALTDEQVLELVRLGRRIEGAFGRPQDIEWCLDEQGFRIVQARPITTLFPVPDTGDKGPRVHVSVGHGQMMTDAMKPLGLSMWRLTAMVPMVEAGSRLFVDVTDRLAAPGPRAALLDAMGKGDPLVRDALETVLARPDFLPPLPNATPATAPATPPAPAGAAPEPLPTDPAVVTELIARSRASVAALEHEIRDKSGPELFTFLRTAFEEHKRVLSDPVSMRAIMAGMEATWWLNDHLGQWLGEKNPADTLTLSAPGNVTSEMGLALLDVADVIRPHAQVVAHLRTVRDEDFLDDAAFDTLPGGPEARAALRDYLDAYGMRCAGEIDITRPRWSERPTTLLPALLDNVDHFAPGAAARRFEDGLRRAREKEQEVLARLRELPDGEAKVEETRRTVERVRTFIGYREYPKYGIVSRYLLYKKALLAEALRLVGAGVLSTPEDAFLLTFDEFHEASRDRRPVDPELLRERAETFHVHETLAPPRVLTSDGVALTGAHRRDDAPPGALLGLAVSAGAVEGRARVVLDMARADLEPGDILVTPFTDPSWSPLFVGIAGLITEVGGLMTHGAVIAREYGLPAVVAVEGATRLIPDGARIRVDGTNGHVELLG
ncbi:rifamycin-inactivating phosphotransferase (plasmid) [Streptomyces sp. BI20]|uniref:rifamycin-inactivating phosphotransferase n=1 Tax=Streptomyces sp. BI20 TaxID=3403460 RepID=UPI003C72D1B7